MKIDLSPEEFAELIFSESSALRRSKGYHSTKEQCGNCKVYGDECGNRTESLDHGSWLDVPADARKLVVDFSEVLLRALEKRLA